MPGWRNPSVRAWSKGERSGLGNNTSRGVMDGRAVSSLLATLFRLEVSSRAWLAESLREGLVERRKEWTGLSC